MMNFINIPTKWGFWKLISISSLTVILSLTIFLYLTQAILYVDKLLVLIQVGVSASLSMCLVAFFNRRLIVESSVKSILLQQALEKTHATQRVFDECVKRRHLLSLIEEEQSGQFSSKPQSSYDQIEPSNILIDLLQDKFASDLQTFSIVLVKIGLVFFIINFFFINFLLFELITLSFTQIDIIHYVANVLFLFPSFTLVLLISLFLIRIALQKNEISSQIQTLGHDIPLGIDWDQKKDTEKLRIDEIIFTKTVEILGEELFRKFNKKLKKHYHSINMDISIEKDLDNDTNN